MGRREIEESLFADFEPLVRQAGVELLDVELLSENKMTVLRATIYRPEGITLDDCAAAQHILSDRLDETDPIQGSYSLEVSSPGLERVLRRPKEFEIFKGQPCQVNLFSPQDGKRVFKGRVSGLTVGPDGAERVVITVAEDGTETEISFDRKNVSKVKLLYSDEDLKKGRD